MKNIKVLIATFAIGCMAFGCSTVNVTKTSKGIYPPTKATDVEIRGTIPTEPFEEIGMVSGNLYGSSSSAYNTIRQKAAAFGADAVYIKTEMPINASRSLINGVAIKYKK